MNGEKKEGQLSAQKDFVAGNSEARKAGRTAVSETMFGSIPDHLIFTESDNYGFWLPAPTVPMPRVRSPKTGKLPAAFRDTEN